MLLKGKTGIILGVANEFSIAWGCAKKAKEEGANLVLSYLNEKMKKRVEPLANEINAKIFEMDVTNKDSVKSFFENIKNNYESIDFLVHSIAFANREDLAGDFYNTSKEGFLMALEISAYSLIEVAREVVPFMKNGGSITTMTYIGSTRAVPSYNVMGVAKAALEANVRYLASNLGPKNIRINAISAGPINTLSARGISGFTNILKYTEEKAPLRRNVTIDDVGNVNNFLVSDLSSAITGQIIFVDCGMNILGV
ncbi:MAG: enoyl-ACP reductase [Spirochaetes bacterium]|nr:enoyl-ACP reductase [Spirochaetota bacterium]